MSNNDMPSEKVEFSLQDEKEKSLSSESLKGDRDEMVAKTEQEVAPETKNRKQSALGTIVEVREKKGLLQAAIPEVPRWFAWICLFFNVFVPGLGTFFISFSTLCGAKTNSKEPNRCVDFLLNVGAALLQLITAPVIIGYILSISWGMHFVTLANAASEAKKRAALCERGSST